MAADEGVDVSPLPPDSALLTDHVIDVGRGLVSSDEDGAAQSFVSVVHYVLYEATSHRLGITPTARAQSAGISSRAHDELVEVLCVASLVPHARRRQVDDVDRVASLRATQQRMDKYARQLVMETFSAVNVSVSRPSCRH